MNKPIPIIGVLLVTVHVFHPQPNGFPRLTGPYLGQKPPGKSPEPFAESITEVHTVLHSGIVFSPPVRLPDIINSMALIHWQFSVDLEGNLYFGSMVRYGREGYSFTRDQKPARILASFRKKDGNHETDGHRTSYRPRPARSADAGPEPERGVFKNVRDRLEDGQ